MTKWIPGWAIPLVIAMSVLTVWLRLSIVRTTYAIHQTDRALRELQQAREQAELKATGLRSPRRLEVLAKARFNLSQPKAEQIVHMRDGEAATEAPALASVSLSDLSDRIRGGQAAPARVPASATRRTVRARRK